MQDQRADLPQERVRVTGNSPDRQAGAPKPNSYYAEAGPGQGDKLMGKGSIKLPGKSQGGEVKGKSDNQAQGGRTPPRGGPMR